MDRREFGKLALSAGAATAGAGEATVAMAQAPASSPSDAIKLPPELRAIFEQDYPRFSDAEYSRRRDLLAGVMEGQRPGENRLAGRLQEGTGGP